MNNYWEIVDIIKSKLEHLDPFPEFNWLGCGKSVRHHILDFYAVCPNCNLKTKVWILGVKGSEIQEVIEAVLEWMGAGKNFEAVLKRHSIIQKEIEKDKELENE